MNYELSAKILAEIKKAKRILLNCHRSPDPDGIGSALALKLVLEKMDKEVKVVCPSGQIDKRINFLKGFEEIKIGTDFTKFNYSEFDLFITLDSASWDMVTGKDAVSLPQISIINIDHHITNKNYGNINLVRTEASSVCELLFNLFTDWRANIDEKIASCLLTGIIADTGAFVYPNTSAETLGIVKKLIETGVDKNGIILQIYRSEDLNMLKFWGEVLRKMEIDKDFRFVWSAIPYSVYKSYGMPEYGKEGAASSFAPIVDNTDFGLIAVEEDPGRLFISFRSRTGFDTSKIAFALGGGGHIFASGAKIEGLPFSKAVEKVLEVARKYAKKTS